MSIIDTISTGFRVVTRRFWLILVPVALDLFLWLGPKLSLAPLVERLIGWMRTAAESLPASVSATPGIDLDMMAELLRTTVGQTNLFAMLTWGRLGMPSVAGLVPIAADAPRVWAVASAGWAVVLQFALMGVGLLIACLFLYLVAQTALEREPDWHRLAGRIFSAWARLLVIFVPLAAITSVGLAISLLLGPLALLLALGVLWLTFFLTFAPQGVLMVGANPWNAILMSFTVVRLNFWPTLGLLLITNVLSSGLGLIWRRLIETGTVTAVVAILASAYVGTALTMSLYLFFRDRLARTNEILKARQGSST